MKSNQQTRTVFVIGAGASCEFSLPTGETLKRSIASKLDFLMDDLGRYHGGDLEIRLALILKSKENTGFANWIDSTTLISQAMPLAPSIDNFLNIHSDNEVVKFAGKSAIVKAIIEAEKASNLYYDPCSGDPKQIKFRNCENTWINSFFKSVTADCPISELPNRFNKLVFIVFNYDRCIEHFLFHAIMQYYNVDAKTSASMLSHLRVYHPYGTVGSLPYRGAESQTHFGATLEPNHIIQLSANINTFTEGSSKPEAELFEMRGALSQAQQIIFLGFAFHDINMNLLCEPKSEIKKDFIPRIFATAVGHSPSNTEEIISMLTRRFQTQKNMISIRYDRTCNELLNDYSRSIHFKPSPADSTARYT